MSDSKPLVLGGLHAMFGTTTKPSAEPHEHVGNDVCVFTASGVYEVGKNREFPPAVLKMDPSTCPLCAKIHATIRASLIPDCDACGVLEAMLKRLLEGDDTDTETVEEICVSGCKGCLELQRSILNAIASGAKPAVRSVPVKSAPVAVASVPVKPVVVAAASVPVKSPVAVAAVASIPVAKPVAASVPVTKPTVASGYTSLDAANAEIERQRQEIHALCEEMANMAKLLASALNKVAHGPQ